MRERQDEVLNGVQKIGLKYYEDIMERIPRSEIDDYNELFQTQFKEVADAESRYEIVGSYRRGLQTSGDIDVIITSENPKLFENFIDLLIKTGTILHVLSRGKTKCLVISKISSSKHARRVDFLYTTPEEYPFSILYFTGSKAFNTVMRGHALKLGYSLNEHEMSNMTDKKKSGKVDHIFKTEKDIFDFLKLKFVEPRERIDGRSIQSSSDINRSIIEPNLEITQNEPKTRKKREPRLPKEPKVPKTLKLKVPKEPKEPKVPKTLKIKVPKEPKPPKVPKEKKTRKIREPKEKKERVKKNIKIIKDDIQEMTTLLTPTVIETYVFNFKQNGITVLEGLTEIELTAILRYANDQYYNKSKPVLTDNEYDIVKEYIERKYPHNEVLEEVGAPITKNKVILPYNMPSMDKIKPDTQSLTNWLKTYKGPFVLSCKLDGVSGMYSTEDSDAKLYTRGDGKVGQDITHLIPYLRLPKEKGMVVRGEFILPKSIFESKYKSSFANPRNLVSGIINSKTIDKDRLNDLHFVGYEIIQPQLKPSEQMEKLLEMRFETVKHMLETSITNELLSETLLDWRSSYEYEIDGVIVCNDAIYPRIEGNPDHAFAFKMVISDQLAEVKVVDVIWSPSKTGYIKPRVRIEPVALGGVTIEYATGFNAKFIQDNKIGIGAVIQIIRSGDVIPYIKSVTMPAEHAKMPTVPYRWTETNVDIILENQEEDATVREKVITAFFTELKVDGLSSGNVRRIISAGYDSIPKILRMSKTDFEKVEGFKEKMIEKVHTSIHDKIAKASILDIMTASGSFGRGLSGKKFQLIMDVYPDILTRLETEEEKIRMLKTVKGIGEENARGFVKGIPVFIGFVSECGLDAKLSGEPATANETTSNQMVTTMEIDISNPLYKKKIVMTKVRDKEIIEKLPGYGATLEDSIKKDTFVLIVKSQDDISNKTKFAKENNIPIMTPDEFKGKYFVTI